MISETAEVFYKCDEFYYKESEGGLLWNDPSLQINWGLPAEKVLVSEKDIQLPLLKDCHHNFVFKGLDN